jgi:SAP domain
MNLEESFQEYRMETEAHLKRLTVVQLRGRLKAAGESTAGLKQVLVDRVRSLQQHHEQQQQGRTGAPTQESNEPDPAAAEGRKRKQVEAAVGATEEEQPIPHLLSPVKRARTENGSNDDDDDDGADGNNGWVVDPAEAVPEGVAEELTEVQLGDRELTAEFVRRLKYLPGPLLGRIVARVGELASADSLGDAAATNEAVTALFPEEGREVAEVFTDSALGSDEGAEKLKLTLAYFLGGRPVHRSAATGLLRGAGDEYHCDGHIAQGLVAVGDPAPARSGGKCGRRAARRGHRRMG